MGRDVQTHTVLSANCSPCFTQLPEAWKPVQPVPIPSLDWFLAFSASEMGSFLVGLENDSSTSTGMQPWRHRLRASPKILFWSWISVWKECGLEKSSPAKF